jgi:hypothetical protein
MIFYIAGIFVHDFTIKTTLFVLTLPIQFFFLWLEIVEMKVIGVYKYFFNYDFNIKDWIFFITWVLHVVLFYAGNVYESEETAHRYMPYNIVTIACLWATMEKIFQYIKIFDAFGFLVQMMD